MSKRIAVIVPPFTTVPPQGQGGTERIAYQMIEGFIKKGYQVTLFGAGKCQTSANFVQIFKKTISEQKYDSSRIEASRTLRLENVYIARVMEEIKKRENDFDIVFNHMRGGYLFLPLSQYLKIPIASILHMPIFEELADLLSRYKTPNIVTISDSQRKGFEKVNYLATVHNGVDTAKLKFSAKPNDYFLFLGALGEHKNPKDAILASQKAGVKLILAGGKKREPYFSQEIEPLIDNQQIQYVGEVDDVKRGALLEKAKALLFPVKIPESFGLVMIEAMACGTPVIAYPNGAVEEVIKDKETGFVVNNVSEMVKAIKDIKSIDRKKCRQRVEQNFSLEKMVDGYEKIIHKLLK